MSPYQSVSARDAVGLMTAWAACPDGPPDLLVAYLRQHLDESPPEFKLAAAVERHGYDESVRCAASAP